MPYITQKRREEIFTGQMDNLKPGDLNWIISNMLAHELEKHGTSYTKINELVGVLECAKLELYRRIAVPYEEQKRMENGEVY